MGTLILQHLDDKTLETLKITAKANGRSVESDARIAIENHVAQPATTCGSGAELYANMRKALGDSYATDADFPRETV